MERRNLAKRRGPRDKGDLYIGPQVFFTFSPCAFARSSSLGPFTRSSCRQENSSVPLFSKFSQCTADVIVSRGRLGHLHGDEQAPLNCTIKWIP